jgi:DNA-binding CsgD family transcriptional regulator
LATGYVTPLQAVASGAAENQPAFAPLAEGYLSLGSAEVSRLEGRSDPTAWRETADAWRGLAMPYAEAYARFRQAEAMLQKNESHRTAHDALRMAYDLACELRAAPLLKEVRELARRSRLELDELSAVPRATVVDPVRSFGLTPREREVLERLASGHTNRQIAEQLFISEKTASVHVSNILRKLSAASRTEAAGIAYRLNLVGAPPTGS